MFDCELIGLPGSGKSRLGDLKADRSLRLTVIDVRSPLPQTPLGQAADGLLQQMVSASNGVLFQFMAETELGQQSHWQKWCQTHAPQLPVIRVFHDRLPDGWQEKCVSQSVGKMPEMEWQTYCFSLPKVSLEHLLFGLDVSKQNLGMALYRVKGVVQTLEYDNPVQIEGSVNRWDTYAGDGLASGWLQIQGQGLDVDGVLELLRAAKAPAVTQEVLQVACESLSEIRDA